MKRKTLFNLLAVLSLMLASIASFLSAPAVLAEGGGTWISRASMPTARVYLAVVTASNGKIYAIGGVISSNVVNTVEEYDPATDVWATRASMSTARQLPGVVAASNGKIYAVGGWDGNFLATVEEYDPATDTWVPRANMPTARSGPGVAAASNGKIYAIGGANDTSGQLATVEEYDPATDTWTTRTSMPTARNGLGAAAASNGKIYAIGGTNSGNDSWLTAVEEYDPVLNTWTTRAAMPTGRQYLGVTASSGKIYAIGGWANWANLSTVEEYDPTTDTWIPRADMPTARYALGAAVTSDGRIYAIGGGSVAGVIATVEEYTPPSITTSLIVTTTGEVYPGDPVSVDLNIQDANDLYAAQATCSVNPAVLEPQSGTFDGSFFDPVNRLIGANVVSPTAGTWLGAISQRSPAGPLSGDGLFATVTYTATNPGTTAVTCDPLLADRDGFTQTVSYTGDSVTVLPFATLNGTVQYQGRTVHAGITVTATGPITLTTATAASGDFVLDTVRAGDYAIEADAGLYLPTCASVPGVEPGEVIALGATMLKGGDVNDDDVINIGDAGRIGTGFGTSDPGADINADGIVNVQDLAILGGNYEVAGCQAW